MKLTSQIVASLLPLAAMAHAEMPMDLVEFGRDHYAAGSQIDPSRVAFFRPDLQVAPERDQFRRKLKALASLPEESVASPVRKLERENNTGVAPAFATPLHTSAAAARAGTMLPPTAPLLMAQAGAAAVTTPVLPTAPVVTAPPAAPPTAPASAAAASPSASAPSAKTTVAPAVASPSRPRDAAFFEEQEYRLRTLKRLRDSGLISEDEYVQKRREVLGQL
jgi:hypothetical protein